MKIGPRITFSNNLDLVDFFLAFEDLVYVILKLDDDFPQYYAGSDIDILCYDKEELARCILKVGNRYINRGCEIRVREKSETHTHLDLYFNEELDLRFDLFEALPEYKNIKLKKHYAYSVIENALQVCRESQGKRYVIYVPSAIDDLLLRYVEYIEWYATRPDKVKHLDYILERASQDDTSRIKFLDKLHAYTDLPVAKSEGSAVQGVYWFGWLRYWARRARSVPLRRVPQVVAKTLRKWLSATFVA
ncbi:MAG: hypothetical protein ACP5HS_12460 [Anaerolineae bacterium]